MRTKKTINTNSPAPVTTTPSAGLGWVAPVTLTALHIRKLYLHVCRATLLRMVATGDFPPPDIRIGPKLHLWLRETVERWLADKAS